MFAFAPVTPMVAAKPTLGTNFSTPLAARPVRESGAPTMVLRTKLARPTGSGTAQSFSVVGKILAKADEYMANCVRHQYIQMTNPSGTFGLQCTEGAVSGMTEVARVRSLAATFRASQRGPSQKSFDMYENRKNSITSSHGCHHEEKQFSDYSKVSASYNVGKSEAEGSCFRYASPETVEEASLLRFMDIQAKISVNPSGVYNTACNEGTVRGQAEDIRVAALNTAYRQGQKSVIRLMDEKYAQKRQGYAASHGCNYEEGLVANNPSLGACFRSKSYGY